VEDKELIARVLTENLWEFHQRILQYDNPLNKMGAIHNKLCRLMDESTEGSKKLILMPRGHLKSSTVTVGWSIQQICKNPNVRILIGSETNANAKAFLKQIRDTFEKNERLRSLYGDHVRKTSRWTDDEITSNLRTSNSIKEPTVFTTGTDQSRTGSHADIVILDDPVSKENINSKEARQKSLLWFREIANNILDPGGILVVIGTRWHYDDLYQYIIDELSTVFEIFLWQALNDEGFDILRRDTTLDEKQKLITKDMMLFPEKFTVKTLFELYSGNQHEFFNNQYMNRIVDSENSDFKETDLQFYDHKSKLPYMNKYITVDPAISEEKSADFTAITCIGVDDKNNWYVLDYDNFRGKPNEVIDRTFRMYERHPSVRRIGIESVQFQKALIYGFRDEERRRRIKLPLHEVKHGPDRSKEQRILSLQPIVSQKRMYLQAGMSELIDQFKTFPKSRFDDIIDTVAMLNDIVGGFKRKKEYTVKDLDDEKREGLFKPRSRSPVTGY